VGARAAAIGRRPLPNAQIWDRCFIHKSERRGGGRRSQGGGGAPLSAEAASVAVKAPSR